MDGKELFAFVTTTGDKEAKQKKRELVRDEEESDTLVAKSQFAKERLFDTLLKVRLFICRHDLIDSLCSVKPKTTQKCMVCVRVLSIEKVSTLHAHSIIVLVSRGA